MDTSQTWFIAEASQGLGLALTQQLLAANAGYGLGGGSTEELTTDEVRQAFDVNVFAGLAPGPDGPACRRGQRRGVLFFEEASFVNGHHLAINGGSSI